MSGYRLLHREQVLEEGTAIWSLVTTPLICRRGGNTNNNAATTTTTTTTSATPLTWRLWMACSDGLIRSYVVNEVSMEQKETSLTASALSFGEHPTHVLTPETDDASSSSVALGCASVSIVRNYAGEDDVAGNVIVAGMDLSGILRIWELDENLDEAFDPNTSSSSTSPIKLKPKVELDLPNATGTAVTLASPRTVMPHLKVLLVAVAFLDGSVALVSTGIPVPTTLEDDIIKVPEAGTIVGSWGTGSALACRLVFRPHGAQLAVSRQDGTVDLIPIVDNSSNTKQRLHRLSQLAKSPSRALTFTTDGHLMIAGNDQGRLIIWDVTRSNGIPTVVNHQVEAASNSSWLWQLSPLDGRRFVSLATDKTIRVWQVDQVHHQPLHSFTSSDDIRLWSVSLATLDSNTNPHPPRMVAGSENGWILVYSLVEKI